MSILRRTLTHLTQWWAFELLRPYCFRTEGHSVLSGVSVRGWRRGGGATRRNCPLIECRFGLHRWLNLALWWSKFMFTHRTYPATSQIHTTLFIISWPSIKFFFRRQEDTHRPVDYFCFLATKQERDWTEKLIILNLYWMFVLSGQESI